MFGWLKEWLFLNWEVAQQRREVARLRRESQRLSEEIERATGEPFRLTPEELHSLAEKSKGIDPEQIRKNSTLHADDLAKLIKAKESLENR